MVVLFAGFGVILSSYWGIVGPWAVLILWLACEMEMFPSYPGNREVGAPILYDSFLWYVRGPRFRVSRVCGVLELFVLC